MPSLSQSLTERRPQDDCPPGMVGGVRELNCYPIMQEEAVREVLSHLDVHKSMGPDGIHPRVMRELADELMKLLSIIYQQSWLTGGVPHDWKLANVTPIHKKGRKEDPGNYRPVNLTSVPSKSLARTLFPLVEYDFFEYKWTQLAVRAMERNAILGPGDPRHTINTDMLLGTGNYARADRQAGFEPLVQEQCQQTGMAALVQTIQLGTPQESFVTVIQGVDEPFLRFVGRLTAAVEKQARRADTNVSASGRTNGDLLSRLAASTRGSAGVDVCTAESVVIDSDKIHKVPLDAFGPLGDGMSAFLMGRSSATIQGIMVHLGLIDADFSGQIHAMVSTPTPPLTIPKDTRIAQLIPFKSSVSRTEDRLRGDGGFGSTGPPQVHWAAVLTKDRPETLCTMSVTGATQSEIHLRGLLDTGADVSILSLAAWPPQWPLTLAKTSIMGLGGMKQCYVSQNPVVITTRRDRQP
ncbi:hypothetical protein DUI87_01242 [Hirundo rustica rustica]|uniref:Peptidase A2 domain-containing protein n=1 Tax=Hirundo rustica rustica TaxID=333673 RepID=A0A3M0L523_HIRRU|nr:hypothetical protein DUI87_01242 [Hirundo rustica rustica]